MTGNNMENTNIDTTKPRPKTMMQAKRAAVRRTRQAQGALERGDWMGADDHLEAAKGHAKYCKGLDLSAVGSEQ